MSTHDYIFRCPYFEKCKEKIATLYSDNDPIDIIMPRECKHKFLMLDHKPLCSIDITDEFNIDDYDVAIRSIRVSGRIRALWFFESIKKLLKGGEE